MKKNSFQFAFINLGIFALSCFVGASVFAGTPQYQIYDIGVVQISDSASQGFGVSPGGVAVGRSFRSGGAQALSWTLGGGLVGLPNLAGRNYCVSNSANDSGIVVGTGATTAFGSGRLPVVWQNGVVSQLPLPPGQTLGDANHVNSSGVAAGSVNAGSLQRGTIYNSGSASIITQTTPGGSYFLTAFGINDSGRVVGQGIDPNNAARNVGIVYDIGNSMAFEVGALSGMNGALAFGVSNAGHVVGSSMLNQGSGMPFIWSNANGILPIPLAPGTSEGTARAVNSAGWAVGNDSSAFSIPFLFDGTTTYRLADLIPAGSGWDLSMNTSSSALGISDTGIIVGTGVHNGATHAYAMIPVGPTPTGAVSRKTVPGVGNFDIDLHPSGPPGIECRNDSATNDYQIVVIFGTAVSVTGNPQAQVISGTGTIGSGGAGNGGMVTVSGNSVTVPLTNVGNAQTINVMLNGVSDSPTTGNVVIPMSVLVGDTNANGLVNSADVAQTKSRIGQPIDGSNFRSDVNSNGGINATDTAIVKSNTGTGLP
jgi:hypothetical protein